jgi:hypothetical protein
MCAGGGSNDSGGRSEEELNVSILYSPSMSTHDGEDNNMDWAYNLVGIDKLLTDGEVGGLQQPDATRSWAGPPAR